MEPLISNGGPTLTIEFQTYQEILRDVRKVQRDLAQVQREKQEAVAERDGAREQRDAEKARADALDAEVARLRRIDKGVAIGSGVACTIGAFVGGRMDWAIATMLPALAERLYFSPSLRHSVLLSFAFVLLFIFSTSAQMFGGYLDSKCPPARSLARSPARRCCCCPLPSCRFASRARRRASAPPCLFHPRCRARLIRPPALFCPRLADQHALSMAAMLRDSRTPICAPQARRARCTCALATPRVRC